MRIQEESETRQKLAVFGSNFGQLILEKVQSTDKCVKLSTYAPSDLRYKANFVRLSLRELHDLRNFLDTMLKKVDELVETIPANKLTEDETVIENLYIRYMIRRNRVDTRVTIAMGTGVGVALQLAEVRELNTILEEVIAGW